MNFKIWQHLIVKRIHVIKSQGFCPVGIFPNQNCGFIACHPLKMSRVALIKQLGHPCYKGLNFQANVSDSYLPFTALDLWPRNLFSTSSCIFTKLSLFVTTAMYVAGKKQFTSNSLASGAEFYAKSKDDICLYKYDYLWRCGVEPIAFLDSTLSEIGTVSI